MIGLRKGRRSGLSVWIALLICVSGLTARAQQTESPPPKQVLSARVLVVENTRSEDSVSIGNYYIQRRRIPKTNLCKIACPTVEECSMAEFKQTMLEPIKQFIAAAKLDVDYIVLTKGMPIRTHEGPAGGMGTDSMLAVMDWAAPQVRMRNPYFAHAERFSHAKMGIYLVTRFDGYTRGDCTNMIDNGTRARRRGIFLIHTGPGHEDGGYKPVNTSMREAHRILIERKQQSVLDTDDAFPGAGFTRLLGYYSWGSNDAKFDKAQYNAIGFTPGGIAETAVSTSARTFENKNAPGQSLIADLIAQGVTGCKGYVSEPYADAIAHADILFSRYTFGYNIAESFYAASEYVNWKDMVLGDPLCAPFAQ